VTGFWMARIVGMAATLWVVSMVVFGLQQLLPGDPAVVLAGEDRSPELIEAIRQKYGLDRPVPIQYGYWLIHALQGDLGASMRLNMTVSALLVQKLPVTMQLAVMALLVALVIGITAGVVSAVRPNSWLDHLANLIALIGLSIPNFWLGIMLIIVVSVQWGLLPPSGYVSPLEDPIGNLRAMALPAITLGTGVSAIIMRHTRSAMLEVLRSDYVRTARAKGLAESRIVVRHALKNALVPVITLSGLEFGQLLGGSVLTEYVFTVPGLGKLLVDSVFNRDYAVVQGVILFTAIVYITLNLLVDILYAFVNPRLRG
jgi:peptide/nickel transport system permease protein